MHHGRYRVAECRINAPHGERGSNTGLSRVVFHRVAQSSHRLARRRTDLTQGVCDIAPNILFRIAQGVYEGGHGRLRGRADLAEPDEGASREAMRRALGDAGIAPSSIDYVNAHGAGTVRDDLEETRAVKEVFGKHAYALVMSSTKSMHGHALGAAPAFEAVACVKAIETGIVPPTIGLVALLYGLRQISCARVPSCRFFVISELP